MWTCWEVVLWVRSNLQCLGSSSSVHKLHPFANTKSAMAVRSRMNLEALSIGLNLLKQQEAPGTRSSLVCLFLQNRSRWSAKKARQPMPHSLGHCPLGYSYTLSKLKGALNRPLQQIITCPFFQVASRKTPCVCSQQTILPHVCFSKNILS